MSASDALVDLGRLSCTTHRPGEPGIGGEERFIDPVLVRYAARIPEARRFAIDRVLAELGPLELKEDDTGSERLAALFRKHPDRPAPAS